MHHHAPPSDTATATGHSAGSGGESIDDFPYYRNCHAISRNETYTAKHIHPRTRQTTLQAHDRILSDTIHNWGGRGGGRGRGRGLIGFNPYIKGRHIRHVLERYDPLVP